MKHVCHVSLTCDPMYYAIMPCEFIMCYCKSCVCHMILSFAPVYHVSVSHAFICASVNHMCTMWVCHMLLYIMWVCHVGLSCASVNHVSVPCEFFMSPVWCAYMYFPRTFWSREGAGGWLQKRAWHPGSRMKGERENYRSVFEIIGKSHYQGQKRTQRLRCAILWQNVT